MEKLNSILRDPTTWAVIAAFLTAGYSQRLGLSGEQILMIVGALGSWVAGEAIRPTATTVADLKNFFESRRLLLTGLGLAVAFLQQRVPVDPMVIELAVFGIAAVVVKQSLFSTEKPKFEGTKR